MSIGADFAEPLDLLIVGAGPTGIAVGADAVRAGLSVLLVERGALTDAILNFPTYMTFFTTRDLLEIADLPFAIPEDKPDRRQALFDGRGLESGELTRARELRRQAIACHACLCRVRRNQREQRIGVLPRLVGIEHHRNAALERGPFIVALEPCSSPSAPPSCSLVRWRPATSAATTASMSPQTRRSMTISTSGPARSPWQAQ